MLGAEAVEELSAGALKSLLECFARDVEGGGDLIRGLRSAVAELDGAALIVGQTAHALGEFGGLLLERVASPLMDVRELLLDPEKDGVVADDPPAARLAAVGKNELVRDASQPGAEGARAIEVIEPAPGDEHRLLEDVIDGRGVIECGAEVEREHGLMFAHEDLEDRLGVVS